MRTQPIRRLLGLVFLFLVSLPLQARSQACGTTVPAGLVVNQTWTQAGSPYCIQGDIQVSLLTIQDGVEVILDGPYRINVLSTLVVQGSCLDPVRFRPSAAAGSWLGIRFQNTPGGSSFDNVIFQGATDSAVRLIDAVSPSFSSCVFEGNSSSNDGGAIYAAGVTSDLVLLTSTFLRNTASSHGGAVRVALGEGLSLVVDECTFQSNRANPDVSDGNFVGGAIYLAAGDLTVAKSMFRSNRADARCSSSFNCDVFGRGGAVYVGGGGMASIQSSSFISNRSHAVNGGNCFFGGAATARGGGLYVQSSMMTIESCIFSDNRNSGSGDSDCIYTNQGGGVFVNGGDVDMKNCTVARNPDASGLHRVGGTLDVSSSIIYNNNGGAGQIGSATSVIYSDVQGGYVGTGNLDFNPVFAGVGSEPQDLQIVLGSPCIDAGDPDADCNDACAAPSLGDPRNDMGAFGGPGSCAWDCTFSSSAISRNGSGVNPEVFSTLSLPAMGECWITEVDCTGVTPGFAFLILNDGSHPGFMIAIGEVLISGTNRKFFAEPHDSSPVLFGLPVGTSPALCGIEGTAQAACFGGGVGQLTNALDVRVGR